MTGLVFQLEIYWLFLRDDIPCVYPNLFFFFQNFANEGGSDLFCDQDCSIKQVRHRIYLLFSSFSFSPFTLLCLVLSYEYLYNCESCFLLSPFCLDICNHLLSACPSVCLSVCLFICLSAVCLSVSFSLYLSMRLTHSHSL